MPSFSDIFNSSPTLSNLTAQQKVDLTNKVYDRIKASGALNNGQLRQFRDDQMETLYEEDVKAGVVPQGQNFAQWKQSMRGAGTESMVDPAAGYGYQGEQQKVSSPNKELFDQLDKRNFRDDLSAAKDVMTDWKAYPAAAAKFGSDLFQLASGVSGATIGLLVPGLGIGEMFTKGMQLAGDSTPAKAVSEWYEDAIKDDPDLYKMYHAAITDATVGAAIGGYRVAKAGADIVSGLQKARTAMAPVVSNVTGGQFIYQGLEGLDEKLKDSKLTDTEKNGIRMAVLLGGALASGLTIEPFIERAVAGETKAIQAARTLGETVESGKSFAQDIQESPFIQEATKELVRDTPAAQNLDSTIIAQTADNIISADAKLKAGQELTAEEAQALQGAKPKPGVEPLTREEVVSFTPQELTNAAPFEDLSSPYWKGDSVIDRVRQQRDVRLQEEEAMHGVPPRKRQPWERKEAEKVEAEEARSESAVEPEAEKRPATISPAEAAQGMHGLVPYGKFATTQRGLATIDMLTAQARNMAREGATPEQLAPLKQHLQDVQATIAIANDGLTNVRKQARKELAKAQDELKRIEAEGKAGHSEEVSQELRQRWAEQNQRVKTLQDRIIVLGRVPVKPEAEPIVFSPEDARIQAAKTQFDAKAGELVKTERIAKRIKKKGEEVPDSLRTRRRAQNEALKPSRMELAEARAAKAEKEAETAISKAAERVDRSDVMTKMEELTPTQQARVSRVAEAVIQGKEYLLARSLTEEERLDELTKVFNSQSWVDRTYAPSNTKVLAEGHLSAGWVEDNYPSFAKLAAVIDPGSVRTGVISPDTVLRIQQDLTARAGFGMSPEGYTQSRELMRETFDVWDEVKASLPAGEGQGLKEFLKDNNSLFGLTEKQSSAVADRIAEAFPDLDVAYQYRAGLRGDAKALADSLTRLITIGADQNGLDVLMHELGHMHFSYGLDSTSKLAWFDNMRQVATDEASWAQAFPGYLARVENLGQLDEMTAAKQLFWAHNPSEMYAQQFSSFVLNSVIPRMETLTTLGRLQQGLKRLLGTSYSEFEQLPKETQQFFKRVLAQPDVEEASRAIPADIDEAISKSWVSSGDRETDLLRVEELQRELDETYNRVSLGSITGDRTDPLGEAALAAEGSTLAKGSQNIWSLSIGDRVNRYRPEDLNKALEMQALSIYHDLPGGNIDEARAISQRLDNLLSDRNLPNFIEYLTGRGRVKRKYGQESDPLSGQQYSSAGERRAVEYQQAQNDKITEFNHLDTDVQHEIERQNKERWRSHFREVATTFRSILSENGRTLAGQEFRDAVDRAIFGQAPANSLERQLQDRFARTKVIPNNAEQAARSAAVMSVAAMDRTYSDLMQFCNLALAKKGELTLMNSSFGYRLSQAEAFASIPNSGKKPWWSAGQMAGLAARWGVAVTAGVEYDPEGIYVPGWGRVGWSADRFFSSPLALLIAPGAQRGAKFLGRKSAKLARLGFNKLPLETRKQGEQLMHRVGQLFKAAATEGMGMPRELKDAPSQARVFARVKHQELLEMAEILQRHYTPKERANIARILEQDAGWQGLTKWALEYRPDVLSAVEILKKATDQVGKDFAELGLDSARFGDLQGKYLTRFYANLKKKNLKGIFETSNVRPIKLDLLRRRGLAVTMKNSNAKGMPNRAYSEFMQHLKDEGVDLVPGETKINSYKTPGGLTRYALADSALDKSYAGQLKPDHVWSKNSTGFIAEDSTNASIKLRRDYTRAERRLMGEVKDVSVRLAYMGEQLRRSYERAHLFDNIAKSKYTLDPNASGVVEIPGRDGLFDNAIAIEHAKKNDASWTYVPDDIDKNTGAAKYGPLAGTYVHRDVFDALQLADIAESKSSWLRGRGDSILSEGAAAYRKALLAWKLSKTVYSPMAHLNNFVSNIGMGFLLGHNPVSEIRHGLALRRLRNMDIQASQLWKEGKQQESNALKQRVQESPYYDTYMRIRKSGMADSSMVASELKSEEMADQLLRDLEGAEGATGAVKGIWASLKNFHGGVSHLYEDGDLIFKMGSFHNSIKEGLSDSAALRRAYEAYFDYSNLAPAAQVLRDSGIVPFISYSYKAIPALVKAVTEHPERLAIMTLALQGIHDIGVATLFGPDDIIKNREALDEARPTYLKKRSFGGLLNTRIAIPGLGGETATKNGQQVLEANYLDLSRMVPGGDMWETGAGNISDTDFSMLAPGQLIGSMLLQSPVIANSMNAVTKMNIALQAKYNNGGDLDSSEVTGRMAKAWLHDLYTSVMPNLAFIPYTYSNQAVMESLVGAGILEPGTFGTYGSSGVNSVGIAQPFSTALASQFGVKIKSEVPEMTLTREIQRQSNAYKEETGRLSGIFKNQRYSDERKQEELEAFKSTAADYQEKQLKRAEFLRRLREARQKAQGGQTLLH